MRSKIRSGARKASRTNSKGVCRCRHTPFLQIHSREVGKRIFLYGIYEHKDYILGHIPAFCTSAAKKICITQENVDLRVDFVGKTDKTSLIRIGKTDKIC